MNGSWSSYVALYCQVIPNAEAPYELNAVALPMVPSIIHLFDEVNASDVQGR